MANLLDAHTLKHLTDDELMIRIQAGEDRAYGELVARNSGPLYGFFVKNIRNSHQAEDLTQDTLLRIYSQAWEYLPLGKFKSWMFRIARNIMIDDIRKQNHDALVHAFKGQSDEEESALKMIAEEFLSPAELASQQEFSEIINLSLEELPADQCQTFTLYYFSGLNLTEVAEIMDANLATTKSRLRLAREKLKSVLIRRGIEAVDITLD